MSIYYTELRIPQISLLVAFTSDGICYLGATQTGLEELQRAVKKQFNYDTLTPQKLPNDWEASIRNYFLGDATVCVPLHTKGTAFQESVWKELKEVPYGTTVSYQQIANRIGKQTAVRAVANAIGKNPVSIFVPCHRVIGSNGKLTGFRHGLQMKQLLLQIENKEKE